jgi:hypothetical protein
MSQSSVPWTEAATDPFPLSIQQEMYTQAQLQEALTQENPDEPVFTPVFADDLDDFDFDFTIDNGSNSEANFTDPSTVSTPDFASYSLGQQTPIYPHTVPGTPQPHPIVYQHAQSAYQPPNFHHQALPFRTQGNSSFIVHPQPPQGYHRRRSLSHGDVDRISTIPPHPTFVRLQGTHGPRSRSSTPEENRRLDAITTHGRSISQGPNQVGGPLKDTMPYSMPGSELVGAHIAMPLEQLQRKSSRKRMRAVNPGYHDLTLHHYDPYLMHMTDPSQLQHSRRIIEIGAMAVQNHTKIDPSLDKNDGLTVHGRIMRKLEDVERHLKQDEVNNEDALKGCAMIRKALQRKVGRQITASKTVDEEAADNKDAVDVPSRMMEAEDAELLGEYLGEDNIMGLLMKENDRIIDN